MGKNHFNFDTVYNEELTREKARLDEVERRERNKAGFMYHIFFISRFI